MSVRVEGALDIMRSADAEPNGSTAFDSHDCYRLYRAADRSAEHDRYFSGATSGIGCCIAQFASWLQLPSKGRSYFQVAKTIRAIRFARATVALLCPRWRSHSSAHHRNR